MTRKPPVTLFSFGYWGWGNATRQLVRAIDAVEAKRGFAPPLFVDIRFRRAGRAVGFVGSAFEELVGSDRYTWIRRLGNRQIDKTTGPKILIAEPKAAEELLALAIENARANRRIVFFCSCQWPGSEVHRDNCHRVTVGSLLLEAASRRNVRAEIVEWPGGAPVILARKVSVEDARKLRGGAVSIPLGRNLPSAELLGIPWGSICRIESASPAVVGPARFSGAWYLPIPNDTIDTHADLELTLRLASWWRYRWGFEPRRNR